MHPHRVPGTTPLIARLGALVLLAAPADAPAQTAHAALGPRTTAPAPLRPPLRMTLLTIVDQLDTADAGQAPSQLFPDASSLSTFVYDEFTLSRPWTLDHLTVRGADLGDPACNQFVAVEIWQGRPGDGGTVVHTFTGAQVGNDIDIDFFGVVSLTPGDYLIDAFVARPLASPCAGGQWFALLTDRVHGAEAGIRNPGGGQGFGADIGKVSDLSNPNGPPVDLQFKLTGFLDDFQDCNANGIDDFIDIQSGDEHDTNDNGIPDSCDRTTDFDLDGIPDTLDPEPSIYSTIADAPASQVVLAQLSIAETPAWLAAPDSEYGALELIVPTEPGRHLYINVEADGLWVVQNQHVYTEDLPHEQPTQKWAIHIDLGAPRGTAVASSALRTWLDPIGMDALGPPGDPNDPFDQAVIPQEFLIGHKPGAPDPQPFPPAENPASPPPQPRETKTSKSNSGIDVSDLDTPAEKTSCVPNAVGGSFDWLNRTYALGMSESLDDLVQEFRRLMNSLDGESGVGDEIEIEAKRGFIRKKKLPLTIESKGTGGNFQSPITPDDILRELCRGQDVELGYGFFRQDSPDHWKRHGGHEIVAKSITKCERDGITTWRLTYRHDSIQDEPGGVNDTPASIVPLTTDINNDGVEETVWTLDNNAGIPNPSTYVLESLIAESPTLAVLNRLVAQTLDELKDAQDAAFGDDAIDLPESEDLARKALTHKDAWERLHDHLRLAPTPDPALVNPAARALQSACVLYDAYLERYKTLRNAGARATRAPTSRSVLPQDLEALSILEEASIRDADIPAINALLPPDADLDGVPDSLDNAPADANPDQADQDNNAIPDVLELSPSTDCNDNGIIDVYEVTIPGIVDYLFDGTPVLGLIFDRNENGIPDQCETPPACVADLDGDADTDVFDFAIFVAHFGDLVPPGTLGDYDADGTVTVLDFAIFAVDFGCAP